MGLPEIIVEFKNLAETAAARSARGILAVIIQDGTSGVTWTAKAFSRASELTEAEYTATNYKAVLRAFWAHPRQVIVVRVGELGTITDAGAILDNQTYHWVCAVPSGFQSGLVTYVKSANNASRVRKVKAIVAGVSDADDPHIVNLANAGVFIGGDVTATAAGEYLPRLGGILAACPITESVTYRVLDELTRVSAVTSPGESVDAGNLVLIREDEVIRIARGVTTLQTVAGDNTADMKKIAVVEAMDLIQEDIIRTFKNNYLGKVRNSADNQALFVSDVLSYLQGLAEEGVLDSERLHVEVDADAMRTAWQTAGKDVSGMTDAQVRQMTYSSYVYITAYCRILDCMEDVIMQIGLQ